MFQLDDDDNNVKAKVRFHFCYFSHILAKKRHDAIGSIIISPRFAIENSFSDVFCMFKFSLSNEKSKGWRKAIVKDAYC